MYDATNMGPDAGLRIRASRAVREAEIRGLSSSVPQRSNVSIPDEGPTETSVRRGSFVVRQTEPDASQNFIFLHQGID